MLFASYKTPVSYYWSVRYPYSLLMFTERDALIIYGDRSFRDSGIIVEIS